MCVCDDVCDDDVCDDDGNGISWRSHDHDEAKQAQACGRLPQAEGPEGPMAPVVTTGCYHCSKNLTTLLDSCVSSLRRAMPVFSVSFKKTSRIVLVILAQGPC